MIEDMLKMNKDKIQVFDYPKYRGDGIYEVEQGIYGNKKLSDKIDKEVLKTFKTHTI